MLLAAAKRYNIDLCKSFMLGDSAIDMEAGRAAGCKSIGILTGKALEDAPAALPVGSTFSNLLDAVRDIVGR
jgi:phosphoglycolate phosphatase-like HAD superfamily hydrolase